VASGLVVVIGGSDEGQGVAVAEVWDPTDGTFSGTGSLATARGGQAQALLKSGDVAVFGGRDLDMALDSVEIYQP
jgi:hypothetical protein